MSNKPKIKKRTKGVEDICGCCQMEKIANALEQLHEHNEALIEEHGYDDEKRIIHASMNLKNAEMSVRMARDNIIHLQDKFKTIIPDHKH